MIMDVMGAAFKVRVVHVVFVMAPDEVGEPICDPDAGILVTFAVATGD